MCGGAGGNNKAAKRPRRRRDAHSKPCQSEFDHAGWKARNRWRRGEPLHRHRRTDDGSEMVLEAQREEMFVLRTHDCSIHCDYPSQCLQHLLAAEREGRAAHIRRLAALRTLKAMTEARRTPAPTLPPPPDFAATAADIDFGVFDEDDEADEEGAQAEQEERRRHVDDLRKAQETRRRRSLVKVAQITGVESLGPLQDVSLDPDLSSSGDSYSDSFYDVSSDPHQSSSGDGYRIFHDVSFDSPPSSSEDHHMYYEFPPLLSPTTAAASATAEPAAGAAGPHHRRRQMTATTARRPVDPGAAAGPAAQVHRRPHGGGRATPGRRILRGGGSHSTTGTTAMEDVTMTAVGDEDE